MAFRRTAPSPGTSPLGSAPEPPRRARDFVKTQLTAKDDASRARPFFLSEWRL
ncbi:hypothetical protein EIB18_14025 [Caulobacter vibrioides]|uniref:Uncharacterized protein n=1 Tax=Caulobacter vibrioides (strain NA1000 / CB15N) TaxID=565050 RepID=A0A0H3IXU1_CAUVN|nr:MULTISPECIES: hypothetical protein [Caulobacter]YP_009020545.1 hypothetical protein CCNA_03973 [Caulobacter vibrioides NA1000]AHI88576.1 hypothetical protein CCNA_03973 [Caulobacter vibrioides NA1000]AVG21558.1 hypothetical protein CA608_20360 [Caulobacter vibrioides]AVH77093.1 hypothetical protein CA607_20500 [Caulobacter vibrioides]AZH13716.1 hypothetical protein EIB18_14025 [Caulobacter vibrioides]MCY1648638.1 hypothetical protein [Caulobacter sp. SL161]